MNEKIEIPIWPKIAHFWGCQISKSTLDRQEQDLRPYYFLIIVWYDVGYLPRWSNWKSEYPHVFAFFDIFVERLLRTPPYQKFWFSSEISIFELYTWLDSPKFLLSNALWFIGFTVVSWVLQSFFLKHSKSEKNVNFSYWRSIPDAFLHLSIRFAMVDNLQRTILSFFL